MTLSVLGDLDWAVRAGIYRHFADTGAAPSVSDLAGQLTLGPADVRDSLERLGRQHVIANAPGSDNIWMAHPFSAVPTSYPVETATGSYWANCAWDALGIPAVLGVDGVTRTRCADSGATVRLEISGGALRTHDGVIHFAVPARGFWDNVGFT